MLRLVLSRSAKKKTRRSGCNLFRLGAPIETRGSPCTRGSPASPHGPTMGKHRVIPCTPPADPDALLDDATAREHIDTLRDVTTEIARTVAGLDGRATPRDVQEKLAAVLAGAAPPSPNLKDRSKRDDLERALRSVDDLRRAVRRGNGVDLDALLETMPEGVVAAPSPPAPPPSRPACLPGASTSTSLTLSSHPRPRSPSPSLSPSPSPPPGRRRFP